MAWRGRKSRRGDREQWVWGTSEGKNRETDHLLNGKRFSLIKGDLSAAQRGRLKAMPGKYTHRNFFYSPLSFSLSLSLSLSLYILVQEKKKSLGAKPGKTPWEREREKENDERKANHRWKYTDGCRCCMCVCVCVKGREIGDCSNEQIKEWNKEKNAKQFFWKKTKP